MASSNPSPFKVITSFQELQPWPSACLYVLDFDETIAYFDGLNRDWWSQRFGHHYSVHNDTKQAETNALKEWVDHITIVDPKHVDEEGFHSLIEHCKQDTSSHILILTARDIALKDLTTAQLNTISPTVSVDIIFCCGKNKGHKLQEYLETHSKTYSTTIFIDDLTSNLLDFQKVHVGAQCFHMQFNRE